MGNLKPLLPLGGVPAVVRCAHAFIEIGAEPLVVTGYSGEQVTAVLDDAGIGHVTNPEPERGMYSSVRTGLGAVMDPGLVAVLPADTPLVRAETVGRLARAAAEGGRQLVYPVHEGRRGHPPLLGPALRDAVLTRDARGGLREVLDAAEGSALEVPVDDAGTLLDMDVPDDYSRAAELAGVERVPPRAECLRLLDEWRVPAHIRRHSVAVAAVAARMGTALNEAGAWLNLGLLEAAALLHDVCRQEPAHAAAGAALLRASGLPRVAGIVAGHMDPPRALGAVPDERALLYLADKLVREDRVVPLADRLAGTLERVGADEQAKAVARRRLEAAMRIAAVVRRETGRTVEQLAAERAGEVKGATG